MGVPTGAEVNVYFVVPKEADRKTLSGLLRRLMIVLFTLRRAISSVVMK